MECHFCFWLLLFVIFFCLQSGHIKCIVYVLFDYTFFIGREIMSNNNFLHSSVVSRLRSGLQCIWVYYRVIFNLFFSVFFSIRVRWLASDGFFYKTIVNWMHIAHIIDYIYNIYEFIVLFGNGFYFIIASYWFTLCLIIKLFYLFIYLAFCIYIFFQIIL